jgi:hypothetical protein
MARSGDQVVIRALGDAVGSLRREKWHAIGGELGQGHLYVYKLANGGQVLVRVRGDDEGRPGIAHTFMSGATAIPKLAELEALMVEHSDRLGDRHRTVGENRTPARHLALWCGIDPGATIRRSRGRPKKWTPALRRELVDAVAANGGVPCDLGPPWNLSQRRVLELMGDAVKNGEAVVDTSRKPYRYGRAGS